MASKNELRLQKKTLRKQFSKSDVDEMSLSIANKILLLPIWDKIYFHVFLSITELKEVNTEFILHLLTGKNKKVVLSKSNFGIRKMTHFLLLEDTEIKKNSYNIPEPSNGLEISSTKIDVAFVPLLAFDILGNRIGYGKGFYDRFLSECKPEAIKIGLSFFEAEPEIADVSTTDVKLDYCISPNKIYRF